MRTLLVLLCALSATACRPAASRPPTRIVLIVVDTLRRDFLSCYGGTARTPNMDRLAARGQRFTNAVGSFHQTSMSMGALFTGRTPSIESTDPATPLPWTGKTWCGLARFGTNDAGSECLPRSLPTLAEILLDAGMRTVGITSNDLMFRPAGFDRGFETWTEIGRQPHVTARGHMAFFARLAIEARKAERVMQAAIEAVAAHREERLFLYVHFMDVHDWWVPGDRTRTYNHHENYRRAVEAFDTALGTFLESLEREGVLADAAVILTADHGESLGEWHPIASMPVHFGNPAYEPVLRVPLIVAPAYFEDPTRMVRSEDVFGMICDLAGSHQRPARPASDLATDEIFLTEAQYQTYRRGRWKTIRRRSDGATMLFDVEADPQETVDVAAPNEPVGRTHAVRIAELSRALGTTAGASGTLSPQDQERLRALGYVR